MKDFYSSNIQDNRLKLLKYFSSHHSPLLFFVFQEWTSTHHQDFQAGRLHRFSQHPRRRERIGASGL
jgi:hypothetical protein